MFLLYWKPKPSFMFAGQLLCELKSQIKKALKRSGYKVKDGLHNFIPLWKNMSKGSRLNLPPILLLDSHNRIIYQQDDRRLT